jgi:hypothetical protein
VPQTRSVGEILRDAEAGRLENVFAEEREPYDLVGSAERLFDLLDERGVDYVLVGGMAMLQYVDGRNSRHVDLIVTSRDLTLVPELVVSDSDKNFARGLFQGIQVDVRFASNKLFKLVSERHRQSVDFGRRSIGCATAQGLLILKLFALPSLYRQGDNVRAAIYEADVAGLLVAPGADVEAAFSEVQPYLLPTDDQELRKIVAQIGERTTAFGAKPEIQDPKSESRSFPWCWGYPRVGARRF